LRYGPIPTSATLFSDADDALFDNNVTDSRHTLYAFFPEKGR